MNGETAKPAHEAKVDSTGESGARLDGPPANGLTNPPSAIDLEIGELALIGFPAGQGRRVADAVERELARLFERGLPAGHDPGWELDRLNAGSITMTPVARPEAVASQIARAIFRAVDRNNRQ